MPYNLWSQSIVSRLMEEDNNEPVNEDGSGADHVSIESDKMSFFFIM